MPNKIPFVLVIEGKELDYEADGLLSYGRKEVLTYRHKGKRFIAIPTGFNGLPLSDKSNIGLIPYVWHRLNGACISTKRLSLGFSVESMNKIL